MEQTNMHFSTVDEAKTWAKKQLKEHGYYTHVVYPDDYPKTKTINIHTHGIFKNYGLLDLEAVIVDEADIEKFNYIVQQYIDNQLPADILDGKKIGLFTYPPLYDTMVRLVYSREEVTYNGQVIDFDILRWRIIFADKYRRFPDDPDCDIEYKAQFTDEDRIKAEIHLGYGVDE